jgi:hypothetical protein
MNYGCNNSLPHDFTTLIDKETGKPCDFINAIWEICIRCGKKMKWNKDGYGRINNKDYLDYHIRDFAQPYGRTRKVYEMIYGKPKEITQKGNNGDS